MQNLTNSNRQSKPIKGFQFLAGHFPDGFGALVAFAFLRQCHTFIPKPPGAHGVSPRLSRAATEEQEGGFAVPSRRATRWRSPMLFTLQFPPVPTRAFPSPEEQSEVGSARGQHGQRAPLLLPDLGPCPGTACTPGQARGLFSWI